MDAPRGLRPMRVDIEEQRLIDAPAAGLTKATGCRRTSALL